MSEATPAASPNKSAKMDMALDDIIKKTKKPRRGGGRGKAKGSPGAMNGRWVLGNMAASLGGRKGKQLHTSGPPKLHISNLAAKVTDADISGIFSDFGSMKSAAIHYNKKGKSLGTADVVFANRLDAMKAMTMINGIPLDGKPMKISIEGGVGVTSGPTDIVKRLGPRAIGTFGGGPVAIGTFGGGRAGRRGGRRGRGGRGGGRGGKPKTAEELDAEMDAYAKNKGKTAEELDAEMDAYAEESKAAANGTD